MAVVAPGISGLGQPLHWSDKERRLWVGLLFVGCVLCYAGRNSMAVSIVEMSSEFNWNKRACGLILSSFFWGYTATQVLGGQLADRYGGEIVLWLAGVAWGAAVLSITIVANVSNFFVLIANLINGLGQGVHFPAITSLLSSRVSDEKRNFVYAIIHVGPQFGSIMTGILGYSFLFNHGWEYMFLLVGSLILAWALLLRWLSRQQAHKRHYQLVDNPDSKSLAAKAISVHLTKKEASCVEVPWRALIRQGPILAMFYANFCEGVFMHILMAWLPTFFHETFQSHTQNAWKYNIAPWISMGVSVTLSGWLSGFLIQKGVSTTFTRKLMEGTSLAGTSICMFLLGVLCLGNSCNFSTSLCLVMSAFFFHGFEISGVSINSIDLAPSYSGLLFGAMNGLASLPGVFGVSLVGHILHATGSWSHIFFLISGISFSGFLIYSLFGSGKRLTHLDSN